MIALSATLLTASVHDARAAANPSTSSKLAPQSVAPPPVTRGIFRYSSTDFAAMSAAGFNAATDGGVQSHGDAEAAAAINGMVWVDAYDHTNCVQTLTDAAITAIVQANVAAGHIGLRYEIGDEPTQNGCNAAPAYTHMTQVVHSADAGAKTWVADNQFQVGKPIHLGVSMKGSVDILAFDVYPCESGPCNYTAIDTAVQQIHAAQVSNWEFIIQDFNYSPDRWPTPAEIQAQFDHWRGQGATGYWVFAWDYAAQQVIAQPGNVAALQQINSEDPASPGVSGGPIVATSASASAYQHSSADKVAYLHDGSILVSYYDGMAGIVDQVRNPSISPSAVPVQTITGDDVTLYTVPGAGSTDIWIQAANKNLGSSPPLEQIQHGIYDGSAFTWDAATPIPGAISPTRLDPSVTWTGKWLIASWWDNNGVPDSDNVFVNWTADKTGRTGWMASAIHLSVTGANMLQVSIRHSFKLGATIAVYGGHSQIFTRTLLDTRSDPSLANWSAESLVDPGYDDSEVGLGGPQIAIDENSGKVHVFRAVVNSGGPSWAGVTYWLGTPDAIPMVAGTVTWAPRLVIDATATLTDPPDIAGAVDSAGKVYVFWATSVTAGAIKYVTLVPPYTSASPATALATVGTQPRFPHVPAQAPLNGGYVPLVYQSGTGSPYSIVLNASISAAGGDTSPPTIPAGLAATASTTAPQVNLSWNASTDNVGVTGYTVYRNGAVLTTVSGSTLTYADNSVSSVTTYSYAVDAFDAAGNHSPRSSAVSVTTPDTSPPTVPSGVAATAVSPTEIDVSWNPATDNVAVTGYTVYRNGAFLTTTGAGVTALADTTVIASTTYSYAVDAFDAAGNHSARSASVSTTTPAAPDTQPPTVPAGVAARVGPVGEVDVAWNASTDNVGVTGYTVYRNGLALTTVSGTTLTYADRTVTGPTTYSYTVDAFDAAGNHSGQSLAASVTTPDWTPPTVPSGLAATVVSGGEIDLTWSASTDNVGVAGYTVYRNNVAIGTTAGGTLSYASTGLSHGATYTFTVDAFDAAGNHSAQSTQVSATTPDDIPPTMPGSFAAAAVSPTAVSLSWSASSDNVAVVGYDVYRDGVVLATLGPSARSYQDVVASGSTHAYTVDAFDAAGNHSATPAPISVTTPTADTTPPTTPTGLTATAVGSTQVNLAWTASTDNVGVAGYTVYRNGSALATVGAATLTYTDSSVAPATNYTYTVDAFDAAGNHSAQSAPASVHVPGTPKFVQGKVVTTGGTVTKVTLVFGPVVRGDLLVGWFGQYDSPGQVMVSDNVNGAWTRSASTTWRGNPTAPGDIALYYFANSAAASSGLTITITATKATYLHAGAAEYSGVAPVNPLDQVVVAKGSGTGADSGPTPATQPGELVYGGFVATNGPGTLTPGSSQGVHFTKRAQNGSGSQAEEDIAAGAAGQQHATFTFPKSVQWFMVCAVFRPA